MKTIITSRERERDLSRRINALHAEAERQRGRCYEAIYHALNVAWQAGHLLLKQKKKVARGDWELWLERHFDGTIRTAQRYMRLAKLTPDVLQLRGLTFRQAYLRLGIAVSTDRRKQRERKAVLPTHVVLVNRFRRWMRHSVSSLTEQERQTLRRDFRPIYEWLVRLFEDSTRPDDEESARSS